MTILDGVHEKYVFNRRLRVLRQHLVEMIPHGATVLDVGCGDGALAKAITESRPDVSIEGLDVLVRPRTQIPVRAFDGLTLPAGDDSVDLVMFVDVLHHTHEPMRLLREADRVCRNGVLIKDHTRDGVLARHTLRFMDRVGNARFGVALPYNYWSRAQWRAAFDDLDWSIDTLRDRLGLYPPPATWLFDRSLQFAALLRPSKATKTV